MLRRRQNITWKETPPLGDRREERLCMQVGKLQRGTHRVSSSQLDETLISPLIGEVTAGNLSSQPTWP